MSDHVAAMHAPEELERCPLMPTYGAPSLMLVRGDGSRVWDADGKEYLDFLCGLAVTGLGHAHPAVTQALTEQAQRLVHVSNLYGTEHGWPLARTLDRLLGGGGQVFFANSGAEANECAIKLARKWGGRGKHNVVSAFGSFHGRTLATLHATGQPAKHEPFQPMPEGFRHVAWNDLDALRSSLDPSVAAVLLEPVQGEGGVNPADPEYFQGVRRLCDERGILFMVDEVQTGLGRTGEWFGFQHFGVVPDVVTMAKALGNGVPIGACWAKADVAAAFEPGDHGSTYGGQPLATAVGRAVLATMEAEDVPARARAAGARITEKVATLEGVADVRGLGLLLGIELAGRPSKAVAAAALERGLIVNAVTPTALRLAPPLLVSDAEVDEAVAILAAAIAAVPPEDEEGFVTRHLLEVDDLTPDELAEVLALCHEPHPPQVLAGKGAALLFEKPSLRTRHSTEMAVVQLGGHPITVRADEMSIDRRETAEDIARTLAGYHATIGARVFEHSKLTRMAGVVDIPVFNLLSDESHPLQAIADLLTIEAEFGRLDGLTLAWLGDYSNVARSLALAAVAVGIGVRFGCPPGYGPDDVEVDRLRAHGGSVDVTSYPADALKDADVVSTDAWYAMGQEEEAEVRRRAFEGFTVDAALLGNAADRSILLHCLPAHRGEEVADDAIDGPHSRVWAQAANRMHAARGALAFLLGVGR